MANVLNNMGFACKNLGRYEEALQKYDDALSIYTSALGEATLMWKGVTDPLLFCVAIVSKHVMHRP